MKATCSWERAFAIRGVVSYELCEPPGGRSSFTAPPRRELNISPVFPLLSCICLPFASLKKCPFVSLKQFTTEAVLILKIHGPRCKYYKHSLALTGPPGRSMLEWLAF